MSKRFLPSTTEAALRERLEREAAESRPAFSESLHRRILAAVEQHRAEQNGVPLLRSSSVGDDSALLDGRQAVAHRRRKRAVMYVSAAACLLCAVAIGWRLGEMRQAQRRSPMADLAIFHELADSAAVGLGGFAASVELTPPPARLSADARLTAEAIMERLPVDFELASE
jgi:hypothetical protein